MDTRSIKTTFLYIVTIMVILAITLSVSMVAYAASSSPFVGHWQAIDVDGSDIRLTIAGPPNGPYQITWTESYISYCNREAGIVHGVGWLNEEDVNLLEADLHVECFTTGDSLDFHLTFQYHPATNTLSSIYENGFVTIWYRPGGGQPEEPPALGLRANYQDNWVESFYEAGHTVWLTVTEADGISVKAMAEVSTDFYPEGGFGTEPQPEVWSPESPDIEPNDWVYGWVDNGASAQMQVGEINPTVDPGNNIVRGTISADWFGEDDVYVSCTVWGFDEADDYMVKPNGEDAFTCDWDGTVDINPGDVAEIWYWGPDGHAVGYYLYTPNPRIVASESDDWFWTTEFKPGDLDISIYDSPDEGANLLWSGQQVADESGFVFVGFDIHGQDILPGNFLVISDGDNQKSLVLQPISVTMFDTQYDFMAGFAPPGTEVWAAAGPQDWQERVMVNASPDTGEWFADFAEIEFDITEDMQPWSYAHIYDEDGDANEGGVPSLELWVAAFTYDPPNWAEGDHTYTFDYSYDFPELSDGVLDPFTFTSVGNVPRYDGYVQMRFWSLIAQMDGECSPVDPLVSPDQATRFQFGWLTDYPMTYDEALAHFDSMTVNVSWDGGGTVELLRHEIMLYSLDDWSVYLCSLSDGPPKMDLRVNYGHDWVESFYEAGHTVSITVTDVNGNIKAKSDAVTEQKNYWDGEPGFQTLDGIWFDEEGNPMDNPPDIQPYDWVYAQVNNGATASVQIGDIQGEVNFQANDVTGTIDASWLTGEVSVECLDWGSGQELPFDNKDGAFHLTNGSDPYYCSWEDEWDVQPWQDIGVGYSTPDGHWVANAFRDERWEAVWTYDPLDGFLQNEEHSYYYEITLTVPDEFFWSGSESPWVVMVDEGTSVYDGYALLGPWGYMPIQVWNGSACVVVSALNPDQPIRFISGWVNDYSMTYEDALAHFNSIAVDLFWDSAAIESSSFTMSELLPFTGSDDRIEYICTFTDHP